MKNYLVRLISDEANARGLACITTDLVDETRQLHDTSPVASAALGRALTGGTLMGALLKRNQRVGIKFEGNGPLRKIIVEADSTGTVRGFVGVPDVAVSLKNGKLDVGEALGTEGFLTVIRDEGLKEPYQGIVKLRTGEIAEDLAYYFTESEQIPSAVGLGVFVEPDGRVSAAGGFFIQTLPRADDKVIDTLIERLQDFPPVTTLLKDQKTPEDLLARIFEGFPYRILEKRELFLRCNCSRELIERVLISLGTSEIEGMLADEGEAHITCEFCGRDYYFTREELEGLMQEMAGDRS